MPWEIKYTPAAERDLRKIPENTQNQLMNTLEKFLLNPQLVDFTKMSGEKNKWRIRSGKWRIIVRMNNSTGTMWISRILDRKNAYKG